jgi:cardiolipin synthase
MKPSLRHTVKTALLSALSAVFLFILFQNLVGGEKKLEHRAERLYAVRDPQFQRSMGSLLGSPILPGNAVVDLQNGDDIFPSMLQAIRGAQQSIVFETYIYWSGEIGEAFASALSERAKAGVKVHVLLDWLGSVKMERRFLERMQAAGVEVERYHKPHWYTLSRMNNRTHRKLLVVDGRTAFTGGVGIADQWKGRAQDPDHWRDSHFRIEGPVAAEFQAVFMDNWIKATGRVLHGEAYFPRVEPAGEAAAQMVSSSPTGGSESVHLMYLMAIAAATDSIHLASAYFVPDDMAVNALVAAAKRGVKLKIITPNGHIDTETVRAASRARWGPLLEAGAEISEYEPTMFHLKMMIVDGHFVSVGSTNFDNRSFRLNDEANLNVYDDAFARRCEAVFQHDLARSRRIGLAEWRHRPWSERLHERAASLLATQL